MFNTPSTFKALVALSFATSGSSLAINKRDSSSWGGGSGYTLTADYSGNKFFDGFDTFTGPDPTWGQVKYMDKQDAMPSKLIGMVYNATTDSNLAYVGVDSTNIAPHGRESVRLTSSQAFSMGSLVVADVQHMPSGCGVWPAFWALGGPQAWPASGEIDIIENVHDDNYNHITLHTSPGCKVTNNQNHFQGSLKNTDCNTNNGDVGCSVYSNPSAHYNSTQGSSSLATAGEAFNAQGGGVYVMSWTASGVTVWMIPRDQQPADLVNGNPDPDSWSFQPLAKFEGDGCDFNQHFENMQLIINTDFCGSWAGSESVWQGSGCAAKTNTASCNDYVANNPQAFKDANWLFHGIKVYSAASSGGGPPSRPGNGGGW